MFSDRYFRDDLEAVAYKAKCDCIFGPPVFIFQDTRHTNVLTEGNSLPWTKPFIGLCLQT